MPLNGTNVRTLTGPPAAVSRMQVTAPGTSDSSTINYTGAVVGAPTGWTQHNSNQTRTAANSPTDANGPTAADSGKAGFILCADDGQPLPLDSIASGNWVFRFDHSSTGTLGPTIAVAVRAFQVSLDLATMTLITLPGATSNGWVQSATFTAAQTNTLISLTSVGAVTLASGTPYLYIEWAIRVTTGGTNLTANALALNQTGISTLPAISLSRSISESLTAASDSVARVFAGGRSISESVTAATDSVSRIYAATRDISESVTGASDSVARLFVGERSISESVTAASDSVARVFVGARSISEGEARSPEPWVSAYSANNPRNNFAGWVGNRFTVGGEAISVTALGRAALSGNTGTHNLKIRRVDGVDVATATVDMTGVAAGTFAWGELGSPVTLTAGTSYWLLMQVASGGDTWNDFDTNLVASQFFTPGRAVFSAAGTTFTEIGDAGDGYGPLNMRLVPPRVYDTVTRTWAGSRSISESVDATTDTVTRLFVGERTLSETITAATDAVARQWIGTRDVSESVPAATDAVARLLTAVRSISESVPATTDDVVRVAVFNRSISESVDATTDSIARLFAGERQVTESVPAATDSVERIAIFSRDISEDLLVCPPCPPMPSLILVDGDLAKRLGGRLYAKV